MLDRKIKLGQLPDIIFVPSQEVKQIVDQIIEDVEIPIEIKRNGPFAYLRIIKNFAVSLYLQLLYFLSPDCYTAKIFQISRLFISRHSLLRILLLKNTGSIDITQVTRNFFQMRKKVPFGILLLLSILKPLFNFIIFGAVKKLPNHNSFVRKYNYLF